MNKQPIGIVATGSYLPKQEVSNSTVADWCNVTVEWIERKTQILTRRYAAPEEATSDLAAAAASSALEQAGLRPDQISYLIVATSTGDSPQPPTAHLVQDRLGAYGAACLDINVVCSGFVYGVAIARSLVAEQPGAHAVVVGADVYSRVLDYGDRRTSVLLGDGAGAAVIGPVPEGTGILEMDLVSRGDAHRLIHVEAGGSRVPPSAEAIASGGHFFRMDGRGVRDFVMEHVPPVLARTLERAGMKTSAVDHFVPHQANGVLLQDLVNRADLAAAHTHRILLRYGNIGSASVPVALDEAYRAGHIAPGQLVLLAAFGGGMAIGTCLLSWSISPARASRL